MECMHIQGLQADMKKEEQKDNNGSADPSNAAGTDKEKNDKLKASITREYVE